MNKKLHLFLFFLAILFIIYLCKDKILNLIEPFQVIITPDNKTLNPEKNTYSVLTYDNNIDTGIMQASICKDDSDWTKGNKTCRDYSLTNSNCDDIGDNGKTAFEACKVACDNCNTYKEIKRRIPSPTQNINEPPYSQFQSSEDDFFDKTAISSLDSEDYRELSNKLDELNNKMQDIENAVSASISQISVDLSTFNQNNDSLSNEEIIVLSGNVGPTKLKEFIKKKLIIIYDKLLEVYNDFQKNKDSSTKIEQLPTNENFQSIIDQINQTKNRVNQLNDDDDDKSYINYILYIIYYYDKLGINNINDINDGKANYISKIPDLRRNISELKKFLIEDNEFDIEQIDEYSDTVIEKMEDLDIASYYRQIFINLFLIETSINSFSIELKKDYNSTQ